MSTEREPESNLGPVEYGRWVGGVMAHAEGAYSPIARAQMTAQVVSAAKRGCTCETVDLIVLAVPAGNGKSVMARIAETLGENPSLQGSVEL